MCRGSRGYVLLGPCGKASWVIWLGFDVETDRQGREEHSLSTYLLNVEYLPWAGTVLGAGETAISKTHSLLPWSLYSDGGWWGRKAWDKRSWSKIRYRSGKVSGFGRKHSSSFCLDDFFLFQINLYYSCCSLREREHTFYIVSVGLSVGGIVVNKDRPIFSP